MLGPLLPPPQVELPLYHASPIKDPGPNDSLIIGYPGAHRVLGMLNKRLIHGISHFNRSCTSSILEPVSCDTIQICNSSNGKHVSRGPTQGCHPKSVRRLTFFHQAVFASGSLLHQILICLQHFPRLDDPGGALMREACIVSWMDLTLPGS